MTERCYIFLFFISQRITIREIRNHPWFLKNLPRELTEPVQTVYYKQDNKAPTYSLQTEEEIMKIVEEAKEAPHLSTRLSGFGFIEEGEEDENQQGNKEEQEEEVEEDEYAKTVREVHASGEYSIM
jgi:serine/threonine-protein kinase SRK2